MKTLRQLATDVGVTLPSCGDNSCLFGSPGGMGTNGGCRCNNNPKSFRLGILALIQIIKHLQQKEGK